MFKIIIVAEFGKFGGTRTYFQQILCFFKELGFDTIVVLSENQVDCEIELFLSSNNINYEIIQNSLPSFVFRRRFWRKLPFSLLQDYIRIRRLKNRYRADAVVISNGSPWQNFGGIFLPGVFLYIMHTYPSPKFSRIFFLNYIYKYLLSNFIIERKKILTVSNFSKKMIENCFTSSKWQYVDVIYNTVGYDTDVYLQKRKQRIPVVVLTLGHVVAYKNPFFWISVAAAVLKRIGEEKVRFIWAGEGQYLEDCVASVTRRNLKNVDFIGFKSNVQALYNDCDIYFQPSLIESQGISVLHAMKEGLPCVVSDKGGLPESVQDGVTGYIVSSSDIEACADKLLRLVQNAALREEMGDAGRNRYYDLFSYSRWRTEMTKLFQSLQ